MNLRALALLIIFTTAPTAFAGGVRLPNLNSAVYCRLASKFLTCFDAQQNKMVNEEIYNSRDEGEIIVALGQAGLKLRAQHKDMSTINYGFQRD